MVKLIACDMDGTLVSSSHSISENNVNAIKNAQEQGVEFIITTGRSYEDALPQVKEASLQCSFLVMNGSELRDEDGNIVQTLYMKRGLVERVVQKMLDEGLYIELYTTGGTYTVSGVEHCKRATATKINFFFPQISLDEAYQDAETHEQYLKVKKISGLKELWDRSVEVGKVISFSNDTERLARLRDEIPQTLGANATGSFPINLEITDPNASKGEAIKRYAESKGILYDEIMTIGDSFNDLSMLVDDFGYTVAMGNALDEVKKAAKFVTATNDDDGVCAVIEKFIP